MYSPCGADGGAWPAAGAYTLQMVQVPVFSGPGGGFPSPMDPRQMGNIGGVQQSLFKYSSEKIVLAAGQYREVRPTVAAALLVGGACRFHCEPAELPAGLQLDPTTGIIWGTPQPPPADADASGPYQPYTVHFSGPAGTTSTTVGLKVVHFQPQNFKITQVSQLERNKYMVLIDTRTKQH